MKLGIVGLGRMGGNMTERLRKGGHEVETYARTAPERTADSLVELATRLEQPRVVWLMIPSGAPTEMAIETLLPLLEDGDILVDGGNSNFRDSIRRAEEARAKGVSFLDAGVSGGIWGLAEGYCLMVGGDEAAFETVEPILATLAPEGGYAHVGPSGAGHFVKMVHNGIEYGLMQAYAEGFELLREIDGFELDLLQISELWRHGSVVRSWLLDLLKRAFEADPGLEEIRGFVQDSGEGRWTVHEAVDAAVPLPAISAALFARFASRQDESFAAKVNAALRNQFGGHAVEAAKAAAEGETGRVTETVVPAQENPLAEGLRMRRPPEPFALTIFGASGDLTQRKLMPALYALVFRGLLPESFGIVGVSRTEMTTEEFRERMREAVTEHARDEFRDDVWQRLAERLRYETADFGVEGGEKPLVAALEELDRTAGTAGNRVYYLAVPPKAIAPIVTALGRTRTAVGWTRLIVEKPFGYDLASARELNDLVHEYFEEKEIFRIDHYLGKETVQNMLVLRFANGIFEPIWNRVFIDHVQITVAESLGVEGRGDFYDDTGAMRDVVQNHLLQLVALTAMEPPIDFEAEAVRNEKVKVLRALHTPGPKHVVRGQFGPGFIEGKPVPGFREEPGVRPDSETETYIAAKLYVDNWRWADTPFYIRTGKRLPRRETTIAIQFQRAPHPPFEVEEALRPNVLLIHIQPDEGVSLAVGAKVPGQGVSIRTVHMDFLYGGAFRVGLPEAYERLILDCLLGDATLFTRADEVEEQWAIVDAMVAPWQRDRPHFPNYAAGSWGPHAADELLHRDGRSWRRH